MEANDTHPGDLKPLNNRKSRRIIHKLAHPKQAFSKAAGNFRGHLLETKLKVAKSLVNHIPLLHQRELECEVERELERRGAIQVNRKIACDIQRVIEDEFERIEHEFEEESEEEIERSKIERQIVHRVGGQLKVWVPHTTFHAFSKLPAEVRLRIWKAAEPGARVVKIVHLGWDSLQSPVYKNLTRSPAPLFVCSESRHEYLKRFTLIIAPHPAWAPVRTWPRTRITLTPAALYFDTTCDTLQFPHIAFQITYFSQFANPWLNLPSFPQERIKRLQFDVKSLFEVHFRVMKCTQIFTNLETVTLYNVTTVGETLWTQLLEQVNGGMNYGEDWLLKYEFHRVISENDDGVREVINEIPGGSDSFEGPESPSAVAHALRTPRTWLEELRLAEVLSSIPPQGVTLHELATCLATKYYSKQDPTLDDIRLIMTDLSNESLLWKYFTCGSDNVLRLKTGSTKLILQYT